MLYQMELSGNRTESVRETYWAAHEVDSETRYFADQLLEGVADGREKIDNFIKKTATHWRLERMAPVDKNILRLAVYEFKNCPEIPVKVTLNEAIEIAKKFGTEESGAFINGVLDTIAKELRKEEE